MDKQDKFHLSASIAIEVIFVGVQMILTPSWGWILILGGGIYLLYALYRLWRSKKLLSPIEMQYEIKQREQYLPKLENIIETRIKKANELAKVVENIPLSKYHEKYLKYSLRFRNKKTPSSILYGLAAKGFMTDNLYYEFLKSSNATYKNILTEYNFILANVKDKILRRLLNGLWVIEHQVNSSAIITALSKKNPKVKHTSYGYRLSRIGEKASAKALNDQLLKIKARVKELLEGAEDEL